jgi:hypothetical protein
MKPKPSLPGRLKAAGGGLGQASQTNIDRRAAELAQMDGRDAFTDDDLKRAAAELGACSNSGAGSDPWEEAAEDVGKRTRRPTLENETNLGEQLTQDGMADAEHDRRVDASDDDSEA